MTCALAAEHETTSRQYAYAFVLEGVTTALLVAVVTLSRTKAYGSCLTWHCFEAQISDLACPCHQRPPPSHLQSDGKL